MMETEIGEIQGHKPRNVGTWKRQRNILSSETFILGGSAEENLPGIQEILNLEDPLEGGMASHSSILAWRIPWTEEPSCIQSKEEQRVGQN